jgi:hypothetical protein
MRQEPWGFRSPDATTALTRLSPKPILAARCDAGTIDFDNRR